MNIAPSIMSFLYLPQIDITLQLIFGIFCFFVPGMAILSRFVKSGITHASTAVVLSSAFIISSLIMAAVQIVLVNTCDPASSIIVTVAVIVVFIIYAFTRCRSGLLSFWENVKIWDRISIAVILSVLALWALLAILSPYPSQITVGLGDPPSYYCIANSLLKGSGWDPGFLAADYPRGIPEYIDIMPIPTLITVFFFRIFGPNTHSLVVYNFIAGGLAVFLFSSFMSLGEKGNGQVYNDYKPIIFTVMGLLIPVYFIYFGLGTVTALGAAAFLNIALLYTFYRKSKFGAVLFLISLFYMIFARPEAAGLAIIISLLYVIRRLCFSKVAGIYVAAVLAGISVWAWINLTLLLKLLVTVIKGITIGYIRFDAVNRCFGLISGADWPVINRTLSNSFFLPQGAASKLINLYIGDEIRAHPFLFVKYMLSMCFAKAACLLSSMTNPFLYAGDLAFIAPILLLCMISVIILAKRYSFLCLAMIIFLTLLPLVNPAYGARHLILLSPVLLALFLRSITQGDVWTLRFTSFVDRIHRFRYFLAMTGLLFFALNLTSLARIRTDVRNNSYVEILDNLVKVSKPGDLIASSYPQLITCMTGRRGIGTTYLFENLQSIIKIYSPDIILVDEARDGPKNYRLYRKMIVLGLLSLRGYYPAIEDKADRYVILKRNYKEKIIHSLPEKQSDNPIKESV